MALTIYQKLAEIQKSIPSIQKTGSVDTYSIHYPYASSSDVLEPVRKKMVEFNLILIPKITGMKIEKIPKKDKKGDDTCTFFTLLEIELVLINVDNPNETIVCTWAGQGTDDFEKGIGKALTYAQKYFFKQIFLLSCDDDGPDADRHDNDYSNYQQPKQQAYSNGNHSKQGKNNSPAPTTNGNGTKPQPQPQPPVNGNGNTATKPQPQPQPPVNGNGNKPPNNVVLRNECVELLKMFTLGAELEKEFFASFKSGATMLSQIPDDLIPRVHKLLAYSSESKDHVETIKDHIARVKIYEDIRVKKDSIIKSGKMTQEQMDVLIVEYTKGTPSTALSNEALKQVVDALDKKSKELGIVDENGKKK